MATKWLRIFLGTLTPVELQEAGDPDDGDEDEAVVVGVVEVTAKDQNDIPLAQAVSKGFASASVMTIAPSNIGQKMRWQPSGEAYAEQIPVPCTVRITFRVIEYDGASTVADVTQKVNDLIDDLSAQVQEIEVVSEFAKLSIFAKIGATIANGVAGLIDPDDLLIADQKTEEVTEATSATRIRRPWNRTSEFYYKARWRYTIGK